MNKRKVEYDFLKKKNSVEEYVPPDYYNKLLKPYVFNGKTDLEIFNEFLESIEGKNTVLEICSGSGRVSEVMLKNTPNVELTLSDLSDRMLEFTKNKFKKMDNISFLQGDAVELLNNLGDNQYDLVYTLWGFSHSVHQHMHEKGVEKTKELVKTSFEHLFNNNLSSGSHFYLIHFDSMSDEQRILMRQWQRVYPVFSDISTQSPSKRILDEVFHEFDNKNKIVLKTKHLIGDPIIYENEALLLEIFMNFHLETYFNNSEIVTDVVDDIRKCIKKYRNSDGSFSIPTGCYIYEIEKR